MNDYQMLCPTKIKVDKATYQRELEETRINKIIRNWDDAQVDPPKVSIREDGSMWAMDGQHTLAAWIAVHGNDPIMCRVFTGLTTESEAKYFEQFNSNNKKPSHGDKLKARYAYGEPKAVEYLNMLDSIGVKYSFCSNHGKTLSCHNICEKLIKSFGIGSLRDALLIISKAYPTDSDRYSNFVIRPVTCFIEIYGGEIDKKRLIDRLAITPISQLRSSVATYLGICQADSITPTSGGNFVGVKSALAIVDIYNKGLKNKLDPSKVFSYKGGKNEPK